jgi:hypothetical protein
MHEFLAEELAAEGAAFVLKQRRQQEEAAAVETTDGEAAGTTTTSCAAAAAGQPQVEDEEERAWRAALARTFRRVDALASLACACGRIARPPCRCPLSGNSGIVGSTAVVAVLVRGRVVVANCGDSRAVLCRGPAGAPPVPLSRDHKVRTPPVLLRATRTTHPSGPAGQSLVDPCRGFARISGHACSGSPVDSSQLSGHPSWQPAVVAVAGSTRSGGDSAARRTGVGIGGGTWGPADGGEAGPAGGEAVVDGGATCRRVAGLLLFLFFLSSLPVVRDE